jgi:predicted lipoprotein
VAARAACACAIVLAASACTIVYDDEKGKKAATGSADSPHAQGFDAVASVESVWTAKVLPYFARDAVELGPVLAALEEDAEAAGAKFGRRPDTEGSPWSFAVKGQGVVVSVNTASRAGSMVVTIDALSGPREVTLQIGPVVRGTAIRDNLPFVSFGDVTNQIQFAQLSRAFNDRAVGAIHATAAALKAGTPVEFTGAMNVSASDETVLITPVTLKPAGAR